MEPAKPVPESSLGSWMVLAVAVSYVIDGALLAGFALTGTVSVSIPLLYTAIGLLDSLVFWALRTWAIKGRRTDGAFLLLQVIFSSSIQLLFAVLAPQVAFYFFTVLFIVFGIGCLALSQRQSAIAWIGVAIAAPVVMSAINARIMIPQATPAERGLVWLCFVATLGRCVLLGVFGRALRLRLHDRRRQLRESIHMLKERDKSLAHVNLELKRQATHDALTGMANRVLFVEHLERAVLERRPFAVCVFDLDRFKIINDSLGHGAGDTLLKHVSERLISITRSTDSIARAGGDEFLALLRDVGSVQEIEGTDRALDDGTVATLPADRTRAARQPQRRHCALSERRHGRRGAFGARRRGHVLRQAQRPQDFRVSSIPASWASRVNGWRSKRSCAARSPRGSWPCTTSRK